MKFKRLLSGLVCAGMIVGCVSVSAFADNVTAEDGNMQGETVYEVVDGATNETITYTQSDIEAGHWNTAALGENAPIIFEDFPMKLDSSVDYYSKMSLVLEYLKVISDFDYIRVEIKDYDTDEYIYREDLTDDYRIIIPEISMDKTFGIIITECLDGEVTEYVRIIKTADRFANMPANVSVMPLDGFDGKAATSLRIVELNENDEEVYITEDGVEETIVHPRKSYDVLPEDLPSFYGTLDADKLYKVFATDGSGMENGMYEGFISTYPGGREKDVYMPGFTVYTADEYEAEAENEGIETQGIIRRFKSKRFTTNQILNNANRYEYMDDKTVHASASDKPSCFVISFPIKEVTPYTVEVIGKDGINLEVWSGNSSSTATYHETLYGNTSMSYTFESVTGYVYYFAIYFTEGNSDVITDGSVLFRIKSNKYTDTKNSYYDLAETDKQELAVVPYDPQNSTTRFRNNELKEEYIDYLGDVDVYLVDNRDEAGLYRISVKNCGTNSSRNEPIRMMLKSLEPAIGGGEILTTIKDSEIGLNRTKGFTFELEKGTRYFIYILSQYPTLSTSIDDEYELQVTDPCFGDNHEPNDTYQTATPITGNDNLTDVWLHKGDVDYYKLTITEPKSLYASVFKVNNILYNLYLKDSSNRKIAEAEADGNYNIINEYPLEPGVYYLQVSSTGLGSTAYYVNSSYNLEVNTMTYYAWFDSPVSLSYDAANPTSASGYRNTILSVAECSIGSRDCTATEVANNSELFIMDESNKLPLTDANLASLANGTYNIVMEFFGVPANGETVTLTVTGNSGSVGNETVLSTVTMETAANPKWYWAACAKMIANSRLRREGTAVSTLTLPAGINGAFGSTYLTRVGSLAETAQLASYFYCGNKDSYNFIESEISMTGIEESISATLQSGQAIIAKLEDSTADTIKYVIIYGVNTSTHKYKIMDPEGSVDTWINANELYSGYGGNAGLVFNGQVIECL